jgi:hypothetical protein
VTNDQRATYATALRNARETFDGVKKKLKDLADEQTKLGEEQDRLRKTITALAAMCSEDPGLDQLGITDSVMETMSFTPLSWTTGEVLAALEGKGFDVKSQKNPQASVHAVLARLAQQGKITRIANAKKNSQGNPWEWRGPQYDAGKDAKAGYCNPPPNAPPSVPPSVPPSDAG